MVQMISLDSIKDIEPQKNLKIDIKDTNVDFLELLLKDLDDKLDLKDTKNKTTKNQNSDKELDDLKEIIKSDLKDVNHIDIKLLDKLIPTDMKQEIIKEIKNVITSNIKQENRLLSKTEIKEFKKIDNLKDLLSFADKKGLDIKKLKFQIEEVVTKKVLKNNTKDINSKDIKTLSTKIKLNSKTDDKLIHHKINNSKSENIKSVKLENILNVEKIDTKSKTIKKTDNKFIDKVSQKISDTKIKTKLPKIEELPQKETLNNIDHKIIQPKKVENHKINLSSLITTTSEKVDEKEIKKVIPKQNQDNIINHQQTMVNEIKAKSIQAKETIQHFNQNLDEAIKNYKPPISKVNIELNPQNLGKVEVSIIKRGDSIQVHMHTDQNNVALFQNNQAEFRQALSNIGFSNIDMSFNSNQDRDKRQNQAKKVYKENEEIEEIGEIEIKADYRYA